MTITRRELLQRAIGIGGIAGAASTTQAAPAETDFLVLALAHMDKVITSGTDVYGPVKTAMWMASLDTNTGRYPDVAKARVGQRVYREIAAPNGSTLYWDQPQLVAAHALSRHTGEPRFAEAADDYVRAFLERCVDENGLFEWGNHRYYDAYTDMVVRFQGGPHEMRPISGAWDMFWKISPDLTEREIRQAGVRHLFDSKSGGFNRHDNGKPGCAFLESGGVLIESLCWLAKRNGDRSLVDAAVRIASYSYGNRNQATGLVENNPTVTRWDKFVCTTEVGLWAGSLLRASDWSGVGEFVTIARQAVAAWLRYGWDPKRKRYYGQINVKDGAPVLAAKSNPDPTDYFPGVHSDIWNAMFPTHDYPMAMAETCVELYRRTKAHEFEEAVHRWAGVVTDEPVPRTAKDGRGAYAELFGRAIHFLLSAGRVLSRPEYSAQARRLADQACRTLLAQGMFRSHGGEDRYDSVDGTGYLLLALIELQSGKQPDLMGLGF